MTEQDESQSADAGDAMIDAPEKLKELAVRATGDMDRALLSRAAREKEEDAKLERRIRLAMAAKVDASGNCFYCGRALDTEIEDGKELKLHPMPYLECTGGSEPGSRLSRGGRVERAIAFMPALPKPPALPDLPPVRRSFGERDDD